MSIDVRLEEALRQVELVTGSGNPRRGKFCVMSLVAFLAGEEHSDFPNTASPVLREFAVCLNDALPWEPRQQLKAFAPRIVATNDGRDDARAELVCAALEAEIFPRIEKDFAAAGRLSWYGRRTLHALVVRIQSVMPRGERTDDEDLRRRRVATVARLLCFCGANGPEQNRAWYWAKAIELLDRMCDVGPEKNPTEWSGARRAQLEERRVHHAPRRADPLGIA